MKQLRTVISTTFWLLSAGNRGRAGRVIGCVNLLACFACVMLVVVGLVSYWTPVFYLKNRGLDGCTWIGVQGGWFACDSTDSHDIALRWQWSDKWELMVPKEVPVPVEATRLSGIYWAPTLPIPVTDRHDAGPSADRPLPGCVLRREVAYTYSLIGVLGKMPWRLRRFSLFCLAWLLSVLPGLTLFYVWWDHLLNRRRVLREQDQAAMHASQTNLD